MVKTYTLEPVGVEYLHSAVHKVTHTISINCSPECIMQALRDSRKWEQWATPIKRAEWLADNDSIGLHSFRYVFLYGGICFKEKFVCWEEGKQVAFCITESNVPGIHRFLEQHKITELTDSTINLEVSVAMDFHEKIRFMIKPAIGMLNLTLPGMLKRYKRILEQEGGN